MADIAINPDVKEAFEAIKNKKDAYDLLFKYYRGLHPLKYSAERLRKAFDKIFTYFAMNWTAVIVDSLLDRLILKGFDVSESDTADDKLDEIWKLYNMQLLADDVHEAAVIVGESFIIALPSDDDDGETEYDIYYNDPRMCHVFYEFDKPHKKSYAAKIYVGKDKHYRMALYYADRFEYYISTTKAKGNQWLTSSASFYPDPDLPEEVNPFNKIPVFHFHVGRVSKKRDLGPSEISLQDAVNKLFADMMVSAEFTAFAQRIIISQADPGNLENIPGANWWIPSGDGRSQQTSVMEMGGKALTPFLEAIDKIATALAIISRTPKHYFFMQGGDPSGEALLSMEAPLNKKAKKRQESFSVEWQNLALFLLELDGVKDIKRSQIQTTWEPIATVQPLTNAQTIQAEVTAGVPLVTSLRRKGWTKDEIDQLVSDTVDENLQTSEQFLKIQKLLWEAANAAVNAGVPLETFLKHQGWEEKDLQGLATDKLNKIKADQEDVIPETGL